MMHKSLSRQTFTIVSIACLALISSGCSDENPVDTDNGQTQPVLDTSLDTATPMLDAFDAGASEDIDLADVQGETLEDSVAADSQTIDSTPSEDVIEDVEPPPTFDVNCVEDTDCDVECGAGVCTDGICAYSAPQEGCVIVDLGKGVGWCVEAGASSPQSSCLFCNPSLLADDWTGLLTSEDFEEGLGSLSISNLTGSEASWHVSQTRAYTGAASLYFGDPENATYDVEAHASARATTPMVLLPEGVTTSLTFALWLDTEQTPGYDYLRILLLEQDGTESQLWHSDAIGGTTDGNFIPIQVDLPVGEGQGVQLAFEFDTLDAIINSYEGAYLDVIRLSSGCCGSAFDCDDGNACTTDSCAEETGTCLNELIEGCCNTSAECDDVNSCTVDSCTGPGGTCLFGGIVGCCESVVDCNDDDPCTEDVCSELTSTCSYQPLCCASDDDCNDADKCTIGSCVEDQCVYDFVCCLSNGECDDGEYCTVDQCVDGDCSHGPALLPGCCFPDILTLNFDNEEDVSGWTFDAPNNGVGWQVASVGSPPSGPNALYFGNPAANNFDAGGSASSGTVLSTPYVLPTDVEIHLKAKVFIDAESSNSYDKFWLKIKTEADVITVIEKNDLTVGLWKPFQIDLSYLAGQTIQLEFSFDSGDSISNSGLGLLVDDLLIGTSCEVKGCNNNNDCNSKDKCITGVCSDGICDYVNSCCQGDDECDDGVLCTTDSCQGGACKFVDIAGCCESDFDCEDNNACTLDFCSGIGGQCSNDPIDGCCLSPKDCDDEDKCTIETCEANACGWTNICCASDAECDDGDDVCTTDACVNDFCAFSPTGVEGCCEEQPVNWDFETPVDFVTNASNLPCQWQVANAGKAKSGLNTLYYGDLAAGNYNCGGANTGDALSSEISLMPGYGYTLRFDLFMDTEAGTFYDKLFISIYQDDQKYELWTKAKLPQTKAWTSHAINLNAFAGKTIQLEFFFDTKDGVANSTSGVFIDDLKIESTCTSVACTNNGDCNDTFGFSSESCEGGVCAFTLP
jgi:hypothetical protein